MLIGLWLYQPETFPVLDEALIFFCMEEKIQTSETIQLSFSACTASYKYCSFLQRVVFNANDTYSSYTSLQLTDL